MRISKAAKKPLDDKIETACCFCLPPNNQFAADGLNQRVFPVMSRHVPINQAFTMNCLFAHKSLQPKRLFRTLCFLYDRKTLIVRSVIMNWVFLVAAILAEVIATSALKASEGFSKLGPSVVVVIGYAAAFYLLSLTLKTIPVGVAYAIWSGLGIVLISAAAWIIFGQKIDFWGFIGMALIISGILVLNLLSKTNAH